MFQVDFDAYRSKSCDLVDVSAELSSHESLYPKLSLPGTKSKLNMLLRHRLLLEKIIDQKLKKVCFPWQSWAVMQCLCVSDTRLQCDLLRLYYDSIAFVINI